MTEAERMLAEAEEAAGYAIVREDRSIWIPQAKRVISVQGNNAVDKLNFACPRYWDGYDIYSAQIYINYERSDGEKGCVAMTDATQDAEDQETLRFTWEISSKAAAVKGTLKFNICAKKIDENGIEKEHWHTLLNRDAVVAEGLDAQEDMIEEHQDIIGQLLQEMDDIQSTITEVNEMATQATQAMQGASQAMQTATQAAQNAGQAAQQAEEAKKITDTATGKKYNIGIENGIIYLEETEET